MFKLMYHMTILVCFNLNQKFLKHCVIDFVLYRY